MSNPELRVELRPHIGKMRHDELGTVEVEHDQWIVMAHYGAAVKQVGYIGKAAGRKFCWTMPFKLFGPKLQEVITSEAERLRDELIAGNPAA